MKTSNKLLLGLAIALFVVPVGGMAIWSVKNRVNVTEYNNDLSVEGKTLDVSDKYLNTIKLSPFNKVSIQGASNEYLRVYLVQNKEYAIKIDKNDEKLIKHSISGDKTIHIGFGNENKFVSTSIYIFAPSFEHVDLSKVQVREFFADQDTLNLSLDSINMPIYLSEKTKLKKLNFKAKNSQTSLESSGEAKGLPVPNLKLDLTNTQFALGKYNFQHLDINLNNAFIGVLSGKDDSSSVIVDHFNLVTQGVSAFAPPSEIKFNHINGVVSDSTVLNLPVYVAKKLVK